VRVRWALFIGVDSRAFLGELVCFASCWGRGNLESILLISPVADLHLRVQECRFTSPSQDAVITVLSMGDGMLTHLP
jgi:hypothetical protein